MLTRTEIATLEDALGLQRFIKIGEDLGIPNLDGCSFEDVSQRIAEHMGETSSVTIDDILTAHSAKAKINLSEVTDIFNKAWSEVAPKGKHTHINIQPARGPLFELFNREMYHANMLHALCLEEYTPDMHSAHLGVLMQLKDGRPYTLQARWEKQEGNSISGDVCVDYFVNNSIVASISIIDGKRSMSTNIDQFETLQQIIYDNLQFAFDSNIAIYQAISYNLAYRTKIADAVVYDHILASQ